MSIIRMKPGRACHRCGSSTDLPHRDHHDCLDAISHEVRTLLNRTREWNKKRHQLIEAQATQIEARATRVNVKLTALRKKVKRRCSS